MYVVPLHARRRTPNFLVHASFVLPEILDKQPCKLSGSRIVGAGVGPSITWPQYLTWHGRAFGHRLKSKDWMALSFSGVKLTAVNGVDNRARVRQLDSLACAVGSASPARVN